MKPAKQTRTEAALINANYSEAALNALLIKSTLTRGDIIRFLGIRKNLLSELIIKKRISFPTPIGKAERSYIYDSRHIVAWLKTKPFSAMPTKTPDRSRSESTLDNKAAKAFLTAKPLSDRPPTMTDIAKKIHAKMVKTTVVHLEERNDYAPPHSHLTLYSGSSEHRYLGAQ